MEKSLKKWKKVENVKKSCLRRFVTPYGLKVSGEMQVGVQSSKAVTERALYDQTGTKGAVAKGAVNKRQICSKFAGFCFEALLIAPSEIRQI